MKNFHIITLSLVLFSAQLISMLYGTDKPNIIYIMADDLGYTIVGCYGSQYYKTLDIDKLAKQGLRMLNHHCQNCAPTRAALMTRQYGARTGIYCENLV